MILVAESSDSYQLKSKDGDTLLSGKVGEASNADYGGESLTVFVSSLQADAGDSFHVKKQSRHLTIENLKNSLSIKEKGPGSGILEISLEGTNPDVVSQQVNEIAEAYVIQNKDRKTKEAENTLSFLDEQLPAVKQNKEAAEVKLNTYRLDKGSIDLSLETQAVLASIVSVEGQINVPVYATIAHSKRQDQLYKNLHTKDAEGTILALDSPNDTSIESLKTFRTALHFGMMDAKNNCIMISGPSPSVGKSFVSVNLAAVLTGSDKKVLLIDADMRRGHLHKYLGLERDDGLSDYISGKIPMTQALHQTSVDGLTLVPTGMIPPDPSELLLHQRFGECLNELIPNFDHIIIDSPPILAVTDATIIGQFAGATMMILKSGAHSM